MRKYLIGVLLCVVLCSASFAQGIKVEGLFDYEITQISAIWSLDPNGGVGAFMLTNSFVPEGTEDNMYVGPIADFRLDKAYKSFFGTVLPWLEIGDDLPVDFFGYVGMAWELSDDYDMLGILGTKAVMFPDRKVHPTVAFEVLKNESDSADLHTIFGVTVELWNK